MNLEDELHETFNREIVRELLLEVNPGTDDKLVDDIWARCGGNPWNASVIYELLMLAKT